MSIIVQSPEAQNLSVEQLTAAANIDHDMCREAAGQALDHAIRCGEALLAIRAQVEEWTAWLDKGHFLPDNAVDSRRVTAAFYCRLAINKTALRAANPPSLSAAKRLLRDRGLKGITKTAAPRSITRDVRDEVRRLHGEGFTPDQISQLIGISRSSAYRCCSPERERRHQETQRESKQRWREAQSALREKRAREAARRTGDARAEAYAIVERLQDVIAAAERAETYPASRAEWARAGEHYRRLRDSVVSASLGGQDAET